MSIFLSYYQYTKIKLSYLATFATPTYSLPQQEIIPIGKDVYLHSLYQEVPTPLDEHKNLSGDFIIYKRYNGIIICIHDPEMPVEQSRIFDFTIMQNPRLVTYKDLYYITDRTTVKKLETYNNKQRHPIVAYGKCQLDMKTQYNLYGYRFINTEPIGPIIGEIFKMVFITSRSKERFTEFDLKNSYIGNVAKKTNVELDQ